MGIPTPSGLSHETPSEANGEGGAARGAQSRLGRAAAPAPGSGARGVLGRINALVTVGAGAIILRLIFGVGFANYDTLYALVWGQQITRAEGPQYAIPIAPTPHPLMEALGTVVGALGPALAITIAVWAGYVAFSACGYLTYRLGSRWFNRPVGLLAALILLTRTPIISYGARAYIDLPFLAFMLGAMLCESVRPRCGWPVLVLLVLAGLLRPEAWVFSGIYWLYLAAYGRLSWDSARKRPRKVPERRQDARSEAALARLLALVVCAPVLWVLSDWLVTGNAMWSLTHTQETATTLDRAKGILDVPEYIPRRIGEILRPAELAGAALGGVLSLLWLPRRATMGAVVGVIAVLVFAGLASFGLPIDTRYAFLAAAILCMFCASGVLGWMFLPPGHKGKRAWALAGGAVLLWMLVAIPGQYRSAHTQLQALGRQEAIQDSLLALVKQNAIRKSCEPVGVQNHAPIPLLALYLESKPGKVVSAQVRTISHGTYVQAANARVRREYILDPHEPHPLTPHVPAGFKQSARNDSWVVFQKCP